MSQDWPPCPLDDSRLVSIGYPHGDKGLDRSTWYCPRCDVAFGLFSPARSVTPPSLLQWHRRNGQLELREEDRQRWQELPRQFREAWESDLRYGVKCFLGRRFSEPACCPRDLCDTPVQHRGVDGAGVPWLFGWCIYCGIGSLYGRDDSYGWEHCANVTWDVSREKYRLARRYATGGNHPVDPRVV